MYLVSEKHQIFRPAVQIIIQWYDRGKKEEIYKEREAVKLEKMLIRG